MLPDGLVDFAVGGRIAGNVQNTLGYVGNEDGLLECQLTFMPQRNKAELTPPEGSVVTQKTIALAVNIRWSEHYCFWKLFANSQFT